MSHFLSGVERVKRYVNAHLHCIVSSLKWASEMSTLPINGKISVNAYSCVVYVYNVKSALYCAMNNHFCVIWVSFVATSRLAYRWMCDSPRTGFAWMLAPTYMWCEHAKAKAPIIYIIYVNCWKLVISFPNCGQWAPFSKVCPSWVKPLVTPLIGASRHVDKRRSVFSKIVLHYWDEREISLPSLQCIQFIGVMKCLRFCFKCFFSDFRFATDRYICSR